MNFNEIIEAKKHKKELSCDQIKWLIENFVSGNVKDYQMASFNMAVWFNGLNARETADLTEFMMNSGIRYNLDSVDGLKADKHSTGGVGDKTSLIFSPLVRYYGVKVAKLSGRGLGQTGGTIDKLESCPGWTGEISEEKFVDILKTTGIAIMSQSDDVVPADKKLYALRDVTGTVDSIPLIASSIMSKKLVVPADSIILDVKVGSGAFMKTQEEAVKLANAMIQIGKAHNRNIGAMLTNMDRPLGRAIGNAIEVKEAWDTLNGKGPEDLIELCTTAAGITLVQNKVLSNLDEAKKELREVLKSGKSAKYLKEFVEAQGGDFSVIENFDEKFKTKYEINIYAEQDGFIKFKSAEALGLLSMRLGAGRETKEDKIDFSAGIYLSKNTGEQVKKGDLVMTLLTNIDNIKQFEKDAKESIEYLKNDLNEKVILDIIAENIK